LNLSDSDQNETNCTTNASLFKQTVRSTGYFCSVTSVLDIVIIVASFPLILVTLAKVFQDRSSYFHRHMWQHWPEDLFQVAVFILVLINHFVSEIF
jgi:hypothetical protein